MKHLFIIHSNTVFLSALGTIDYEKIDYNDIVFFYARNFVSEFTPKGIAVFDITNEYSLSQQKDSNYNRKKLSLLVKLLDKTLENNVGTDFIAYVPHTIGPFQPIITNPLCKEVRLIQEGAFSFYKLKNKVFNIFIKNLLFSNDRVWFQSSWNIPPKRKRCFNLTKTYAITKEYFSAESDAQHIIIKWPKFSDNRLLFPKGTNFFLFESAIELKQIDKKSYLQGCEELIRDSHVKECYVKFHPNQKEENIKEILKLFNDIDVKRFEIQVPFELVIASNSRLNLYGFSTSLIKFGEDYGHNVMNYTSVLCQLSRNFNSYIKSMS